MELNASASGNNTVNKLNLTKIIFLWLVVCLALPPVGVDEARGSAVRTVEDIQVYDKPARIAIRLSGKTDYKIIRLEEANSMSIALRDVVLAGNIQTAGPGRFWVSEFRFVNLPDGVVSLKVISVPGMGTVDAEWGSDAKTLTIRVALVQDGPPRKTRDVHLKRKPASLMTVSAAGKTTNAPQPSAELPPAPKPEISLPAVQAIPVKNKLTGSIDDFLDVFSSDGCGKEEPLQKATDYCRKGLYEEAHTIIDAFLQSGPSEKCREAAFFLKGLTAYKHSEGADEFQLLEAANELQDAISYYAQSKYTPFALTMLGKIYVAMNNDAEALGYFKIVLGTFKKYPGTPEVLFEVGRLYAKSKKTSQAISYYEQAVNQYPGNVFEKETKLELGKAYFELNRFSKALEHLEALVDAYPRMMYTSPDLLITIGNCYYQTAKYPKARDVLAKAYNIYPNMSDNHITLTRIGDTYADEKRIDKAKKIYEQVRDRYPGTDGFIISSLRLANLTDKPDEKEKIYRMIMEDFPNHPMADLSRLRLAEIQQKEGKYKESIATINELIQVSGRALRREAEYLQEQSFEKYFQQRMAVNDYPHILQTAEKERKAIKRIESPNLFYLSGKAFYLGNLYPQAADNLGKAYKLFQDSKRPKDLLFLLGKSLLEAGALEDGLVKLNQYLLEDPKGEYVAEAHMRIGRGWLEKKDYQKAEGAFQNALLLAKNDSEKADVLMLLSRVSAGTGKYEEKTERIMKAIKLYASIAGSDPAPMSSAYRELGETFLAMGSYGQAVDAFTTAIQYFRREEGLAGLRYLLAEAYLKSKASDRAAQVYREVAATGDPIWGKLAEERLRSIAFENRLERT